MSDSPFPATSDPGATPAPSAGFRRFIIASGLLILGFSLSIYQLLRFSLQSELYSYILIVPFISAYFVWIDRHKLSPPSIPLPRRWAYAFLAGGLGFLLWLGLILLDTQPIVPADRIALAMTSFVLLLSGCALYFLGRNTFKVLAFPLGFLFFLAPLPVEMEAGLETILQHGSSFFAHLFFQVSGMPVYRDGTFFQLPGFGMQVAPECSGIRSTIALFLTSLVAGQLFLHSKWKRAVLTLIVLPLALVRNGFRVFVIGELCVKVSPDMIHSWIHRQGGPVFFALSLIPFSIILYFLYKSDRRDPAAHQQVLAQS